MALPWADAQLVAVSVCETVSPSVHYPRKHRMRAAPQVAQRHGGLDRGKRPASAPMSGAKAAVAEQGEFPSALRSVLGFCREFVLSRPCADWMT